MDRERVHEVARGRVWTGADAAQRGLVDVLGGYPAALAELRRRLELAPGAVLKVKTFPPARPPLARLLRKGSDDPAEQAPAAAALAVLPVLAGLPAPWRELAAALLSLDQPPRVLALADLPELRW